MSEYFDFVKTKEKIVESVGHNASDLNANLFDFQRAIVKWALKKGRCAIFADTGLGKTLMQISWADNVSKETNAPVLILAPLAVSSQTINEGIKFGVSIRKACSDSEIKDGVWITNYEQIDNIDLSIFGGIVLDESSILKSHDGKTRNKIISSTSHIKYKLSCTATPSPNDFEELGNQCEFLGIMSRVEMLATYFLNDAGDTGTWKLKNWGQSEFWKWMGTWAVAIRNPEDIGFDGSKYKLNGLNYIEHIVNIESDATDDLFLKPALGLAEKRKAQRNSIEERCNAVSELINNSDEFWIVWCHLNDEAELLNKLIPDSINVKGSDDKDFKEKSLIGFSNKEFKVLITKPKIAGFGMNWQHCNNMAFVGIDDSFEKFYQCVRRCYRFGQDKSVNVHIFVAESEGNILSNLKRKEDQHHQLSNKMVNYMKDIMQDEITGSRNMKIEYKEDCFETNNAKIHLSDCVNLAKKMDNDSIDYSIFSPPFADLFTYSNSYYDMGNCSDDDEFIKQFKFLIKELYRVIKPGRNVSFHCMNLPTTKTKHGHIGIRDFRGDLIRAFQQEGFIYHSEVCIWKDPVVAMQRTKALGLLHKTIRENSTMSRMGLPDYVVTMRKNGDCNDRVTHGDDLPVELWQKYASPVWDDINQSRTLNKLPARDENDEKHMCPLQLDVIERCIHLWTNKGDLVFSPFTGIGSEGYCAVKMGRKFIGSELKESYWNIACQNISEAENIDQFALF